MSILPLSTFYFKKFMKMFELILLSLPNNRNIGNSIFITFLVYYMIF